MRPLNETSKRPSQAINDGADVNAKNKYERTPLHYAAIKGRKEIAELLRKHSGKTAEQLKTEATK